MHDSADKPTEPTPLSSRIILFLLAGALLYWLWFILSGMPSQVMPIPGEKITLIELEAMPARREVIIEGRLDKATGPEEPVYSLVVWELEKHTRTTEESTETEIISNARPPLILAADGRTIGIGGDYELRLPTHRFDVPKKFGEYARKLSGFRAGDAVVIGGTTDGQGSINASFITDGPYSDYQRSMTWRRWLKIILIWTARLILTPLLGLMMLGCILPDRHKKHTHTQSISSQNAPDTHPAPEEVSEIKPVPRTKTDTTETPTPAPEENTIDRDAPPRFNPKDGSVPRNPK